jgi:hypothetical protein
MEAHIIDDDEAKYVDDMFRTIMDAMTIQKVGEVRTLSPRHALMALAKASGFILSSMPDNIRPQVISQFTRQVKIDTEAGVKLKDEMPEGSKPTHVDRRKLS